MHALSPVTRTELRPAYVQIAEQLRRAILGLKVPEGVKLPSETELISRFGVARMTVREGIRVLRNEGLLNAEQGRGVFVSGGAALPLVGMGQTASANEAAWREDIASQVGRMVWESAAGEGDWARQALRLGTNEAMSRAEYRVSDGARREETGWLYVPVDVESAPVEVASAMAGAKRWVVSVRAGGPGDLPEMRDQLVTSRIGRLASAAPVVAARGVRYGLWSVTTEELI